MARRKIAQLFEVESPKVESSMENEIVQNEVSETPVEEYNEVPVVEEFLVAQEVVEESPVVEHVPEVVQQSPVVEETPTELTESNELPEGVKFEGGLYRVELNVNDTLTYFGSYEYLSDALIVRDKVRSRFFLSY